MEAHELKRKVAKIQEKTCAVEEIVKKMRSDEFVKEANGNGRKPEPEEDNEHEEEQRPDLHSPAPRGQP